MTLGAGSNVTIDLGSDEDELELDVNLGANVVTIDLGSGSDVLDIDVAQTATHIVENFGTGDVLDLATFNITGALDTQLYATSAEATSAITAAAGGTSIALHENGSDIDVYIDTDDDGTVDMSITIDSVSSLTSGQFEL